MERKHLTESERKWIAELLEPCQPLSVITGALYVARGTAAPVAALRRGQARGVACRFRQGFPPGLRSAATRRGKIAAHRRGPIRKRAFRRHL